MRNPTFITDVTGHFRPSQLQIVWHDETRPPDPALDALIAETWDNYAQTCHTDGVMLFNGQLVRHLRHRVIDNSLIIDAGPTDYAQFVGTNFFNHSRGNHFGWETFSNPIGTSATVITADGWLLLGRRNRRVAFHAGWLHPVGGGLEPRDRRDDNTIDAFTSIRRELHEELGITSSDLDDLTCVGLIRDATIRQPELVFDARTRLTRTDIIHQFQPHKPDQEHSHIEACRDEPAAVVSFIRSTQLITPVAVGALCLHGRQSFGRQWYEQTLHNMTAST